MEKKIKLLKGIIFFLIAEIIPIFIIDIGLDGRFIINRIMEVYKIDVSLKNLIITFIIVHAIVIGLLGPFTIQDSPIIGFIIGLLVGVFWGLVFGFIYTIIAGIILHFFLYTGVFIFSIIIAVIITIIALLYTIGIVIDTPEERLIKLNKALFDAVNNNDIQSTQKLLEKGAEINHTNLLEIAVKNKKKELCCLLVQNGANAGNSLKIALSNRDAEILSILLKNFKDNWSYSSLLELAVSYQDKDSVKVLLNSITYNKFDLDIPLNIAVKNNDVELVSLLLAQGANVNRIHEDHTVLDITNNEEIIKVLKIYGAKTKLELNEEALIKEKEQRIYEESKKKELNEKEKKRNETLRKIKSLPPEKCSNCGGTGIKSYGTLTYKCLACDGKGIRNADGSIINDGTSPCPACYGTGRIGQNTCYKCKGLRHIWVN